MFLTYKVNREIKGPNVYRFKVEPIDLKDQNFAIAALELKTKRLENELKSAKQERERERERAKVYWTIGGITLLVLVVLLIVSWRKRKKA